MFFSTPTHAPYDTISLHDALPICHRAAGTEGRPPRAQGVQHAAQAKEVGPVVHGLAARLLGGHVLRRAGDDARLRRSEEHTSELQSHSDIVCRLLLEKKKKIRVKD